MIFFYNNRSDLPLRNRSDLLSISGLRGFASLPPSLPPFRLHIRAEQAVSHSFEKSLQSWRTLRSST